MKSISIIAAGALVGAVGLFTYLQNDTVASFAERAVPSPSISAERLQQASASGAPASSPATQVEHLPAAAPVAAEATVPAALNVHPGALDIPVVGITAEQLLDTFNDKRAAERHEAIDIMAPLKTPVIAVDDGPVVKLFDSLAGGLTVYQYDTSGRFAYYYAHLDSYAAGLAEGQELKRGELLGYVGVSGNANPLAPHLHFAIFQLGPEKRWWQGTAINPYPLFKR